MNTTSIGDLLQNVLDEMLEGLQILNREWKYVYVNETVSKQAKKGREDLIGRTIMECYPGFENTILYQQMKISMDKKVSIRMENEFVYPDSTKGWFQLYIHPCEVGVLIFSIDITDRRLAEEKLINKVKELNAITNVAVDRELEMSELREKIKKLEQLLPAEQPSLYSVKS